MGKYCKTYNVICTCVTCEDVECAYSPRTRAEAEIARGVKLDKFGRELKGDEERIPVAKAATAPTDDALITRREPVGQRDVAILASAAILAVVIVGLIVYALMPGSDSPAVVANQTLVRPVPSPEAPPTPAPVPEPPPPEVVAPPVPTAELPPTPEPTAPPQPAVAEAHSADDDESLLTVRAPVRELTDEIRKLSTELKEQGNRYLQEQDFLRAREYFRRSIEENPQNFQGYNNLANTFSDTGDYLSAEPLYREALLIQPESTDLRFNLANTLYRARRFADAAREAEEVTRRDPNDTDAHLIAGIAFFELGQFSFAARHFEEMTRRNPENAVAFYNLHLAHQRMGNRTLANTFFNEAVRIDPRLRSEDYRRRLRQGG